MVDFVRDRLARRGLKIVHLRLLQELAASGQVSAAASGLAMSQPAASRHLAELEAITGHALYERRSRGLELTSYGRSLAIWATRILGDLNAADRELEEMAAGQRGLVSIGSVTGPALDLVLPALRRARVTHPGISGNVVVDTSDKLAELLHSDRLDFFIGRIPSDDDHKLFKARLIGPEPMMLIVRENHPLLRLGNATIREGVEYDWVLQAPGGLLRRTVETYLLERGLPLPARILSTSSTLMTLAIISQSNAIAALSLAVADFFISPSGLDAKLAKLPIAPDLSVMPYSMLRLADRPLSPASRMLWDIIASQIPDQAG